MHSLIARVGLDALVLSNVPSQSALTVVLKDLHQFILNSTEIMRDTAFLSNCIDFFPSLGQTRQTTDAGCVLIATHLLQVLTKTFEKAQNLKFSYTRQYSLLLGQDGRDGG